MSLAGREAELHRQAIGVHDSVNLARKPASRPSSGDGAPHPPIKTTGSQYRLIGRWRAFLYLIRNSFFVPQVERAFWFAGFHRLDYSLSEHRGLVSS
jgi:hypothetical protein